MKKFTWKYKLLLLLVIVTLLGFIPWESWFSIEIRNDTLQTLAGGALAHGGAFLLICIGFPMVFNRASVALRRFLFFLYALSILISGVFFFFSTIGPLSCWHDESVYQNGSDYVIIQRMNYPMVVTREDWRVIRTNSTSGSFRMLEDSRVLKFGENYTKYNKQITYANLTWQKVSLSED